MIILFCDFGTSSPYLGQVKAVLARMAPDTPVIDLISDAPAFNIQASSSLLAAYSEDFPDGDIFWCVVDPGVGTSQRLPVIVRADGKWFVGPNNGLFGGIAARATDLSLWKLRVRKETLSKTFHGRDLFAPAAATIARGGVPPCDHLDKSALNTFFWSDRAERVVYIDHFGNLITGVWSHTLSSKAMIIAGGYKLKFAPTFGAVQPGTAFWYNNSNHLVELAVSQGSAAVRLGLEVGSTINIIEN